MKRALYKGKETADRKESVWESEGKNKRESEGKKNWESEGKKNWEAEQNKEPRIKP